MASSPMVGEAWCVILVWTAWADWADLYLEARAAGGAFG